MRRISSSIADFRVGIYFSSQRPENDIYIAVATLTMFTLLPTVGSGGIPGHVGLSIGCASN